MSTTTVIGAYDSFTNQSTPSSGPRAGVTAKKYPLPATFGIELPWRCALREPGGRSAPGLDLHLACQGGEQSIEAVSAAERAEASGHGGEVAWGERGHPRQLPVHNRQRLRPQGFGEKGRQQGVEEDGASQGRLYAAAKITPAVARGLRPQR